MFDDPIGQRPLKTNVPACFFGFDPFVPQNFFAFGLKLAVKRGILQEIVCLSWLFSIIRHSTDQKVFVE